MRYSLLGYFGSLLLVFVSLAYPALTYAQGDGQINLPDQTGWPDQDIALMKAMDADLSFGVGDFRTQADAIASWKTFLGHPDATEEQKVFANWRIASLYTYNFDPIERNEKADYAAGEHYLLKTRDLIPNIVSQETVNATTLYATLPGDPIDRVRRLSESYKWIRQVTPRIVESSAPKLSAHGRIVDAKFYARATSNAQLVPDRQVKMLTDQVREGQESLVRSMSEFIHWDKTDWAADALIDAVRDVATEEDLKRLVNTSRRYAGQGAVSDVIASKAGAYADSTPTESMPISEQNGGSSIVDRQQQINQKTESLATANNKTWLILLAVLILVLVILGLGFYRTKTQRP